MEKEFVCARHEKIWNDYLSELAKNSHLFFHLRFFSTIFLQFRDFLRIFAKEITLGQPDTKNAEKYAKKD